MTLKYRKIINLMSGSKHAQIQDAGISSAKRKALINVRCSCYE